MGLQQSRTFTHEEAATVLAALRNWQLSLENLGLTGSVDPTEVLKTAFPQFDHFEDTKPLTLDEIDALCETINLGPEENRPAEISPEPTDDQIFEARRDLMLEVLHNSIKNGFCIPVKPERYIAIEYAKYGVDTWDVWVYNGSTKEEVIHDLNVSDTEDVIDAKVLDLDTKQAYLVGRVYEGLSELGTAGEYQDYM